MVIKVSDIEADLQLADKVINDVIDELIRQRELYSVQRHSDLAWLPILTEELGEVAEALQKDSKAFKDTDSDNLEKELIQIAAVAISWVACIRAREE